MKWSARFQLWAHLPVFSRLHETRVARFHIEYRPVYQSTDYVPKVSVCKSTIELYTNQLSLSASRILHYISQPFFGDKNGLFLFIIIYRTELNMLHNMSPSSRQREQLLSYVSNVQKVTVVNR
jgi:hypothetical protein